MSKHTKGPWIGKVTSAGQALIYSEATGESVAVAYRQEDADLIASAPEMLDLLKRALLLLDKAFEAEGNVFGQRWNEATDVFTEVRTVIAKAGGEA